MVDRILETTMYLFMEQGIRVVSMDDIANKLGVSKKTLYVHFSSKKELVSKSVDFHLALEKKDLEEILSQNLDPIDEIISIGKHGINKIRGVSYNARYDMKKYYAEEFEKIYDFETNFMNNIFKENLMRGIEKGVYRKNLCVDFISSIYRNSITNLITNEQFILNKSGVDKICALHLEYHLYGIIHQDFIHRVKEINL